ncbi:hypothetical protein CPAR01_12168 [Colletotrichum paranaense]|uniref:Uncharacterized protein n=5 Tax=Colletotrichum acutatum species complex TaxID=2707335 RepID=A0A9Q8SUY0_9PEZI|nr:uncharacterized protein CLUP02_09570 [Colletotrichum lupini]XP_060312593.1 uncharacterized protein CCOS01_08158 [Colletotrichum costaricense]XP_060345211.1 uncharacterized protein CPAR01_12168 [Colletotrichum paranaense]XP_060376767.1 uncharacterized protein CTAM01_12608 [Colletotrichum tamarilloi]KAI3547040.1 hypothetical protein CSPX01_03872 [Colletotrichum filicis]KAK1469967.1 hypothetical protein CMEL01_01734 [Colletotrichum melonis]KAK1485393.1 hypothetical protein CTAM01_12608 [Colle
MAITDNVGRFMGLKFSWKDSGESATATFHRRLAIHDTSAQSRVNLTWFLCTTSFLTEVLEEAYSSTTI